MRAERISRDNVAAAARIAADLILELEQPEVGEAGLGQRPAGGEAGDAAAGDDQSGLLDAVGRREAALAQPMAAGEVGAAQLAGGRLRPRPGPAEPGAGRRTQGPEARQNIAAVSPHSAPIPRRRSGPG